MKIDVDAVELEIHPSKVRIHLDNENDFNHMMAKVVNTIKMPLINLVSRGIEKYLQ